MPNSIALVLQEPEGELTRDFEGYFRRNFPTVIVEKRNYENSRGISHNVLVIAPIERSGFLYEANAEAIGRLRGNPVFLLTDGLNNSPRDIVSGLTGIIFRLEGESDFRAFDAKGEESAAELLRWYLEQ